VLTQDLHPMEPRILDGSNLWRVEPVDTTKSPEPKQAKQMSFNPENKETPNDNDD
jgi:hypothetical protein